MSLFTTFTALRSLISPPPAPVFTPHELEAVDLLWRHANRYVNYGCLEGHEQLHELMSDIVPEVRNAVRKMRRTTDIQHQDGELTESVDAGA